MIELKIKGTASNFVTAPCLSVYLILCLSKAGTTSDSCMPNSKGILYLLAPARLQ